MYLPARLFGIFTYLCMMLLFSGLISRFKEEEIPKLLAGCNICLCVMAYFYCYTTSDDLSRLLPIMHLFADMDTEDFIKNISFSNMPLLEIFYRIIGKFHNDRLLPAVTSLISYSFIFTIIKKSSVFYQSANNNIAIAFILMMERGFFVIGISNVRTLIVISIFSYLIYSELIESKFILPHLPLYIMISLFHNMGLLLTLLRLVFLFISFDKKKNKITTFAIIAGVLVTAFRYGRNYLENFTSKASGYIEANYNGTAYDYVYERIISLLFIIGLCALLLCIKRNAKWEDENFGKFKSFYKFNWFIILIEMALFFLDYTSFFRLSWLVAILIVPTFLFIAKNIKEEEFQIATNRALFICSIGFVIEMARGYLCSLKYFESFLELIK